MANSEERKRQIMDHIQRSSQLPQQLSATSTNTEARKKQIIDHVKRSLNS
jgi:negative regulator of replication initiation